MVSIQFYFKKGPQELRDPNCLGTLVVLEWRLASFSIGYRMYVGILVGSNPRSSHQRPVDTMTSLSEGVNVDVGIIIASVPSRLAPYFPTFLGRWYQWYSNPLIIDRDENMGVSLFHGGTPLSLDLCLFMFISWFSAIYF